MKKTLKIIAIVFAIIFTSFLASNVYAASLDNITSAVDKETVKPGEDVKVTINFGTSLGSATVHFAYDNKIFSYVSTDAGTATDSGEKIQVVFDDETSGSNSIKSITLTFKAKDDITTSNPTEFTIIGENFKNADKTETYDDITTPIVENVTVEPEYIDYSIDLSYEGDIIANEEKDMTLVYASSMGRYYEHVRLVAEATTPEGATVKLTGMNEDSNAEQDLILNGWGDPQGYGIGGKDFKQTLSLKGIFSAEGKYSVTFKLIDRDNSDKEIVSKTIEFDVKAKETVIEETEDEEKQEEVITPETEENDVTEETQKPESLPKTGENIYLSMALIAVILSGATVALNRKK